MCSQLRLFSVSHFLVVLVPCRRLTSVSWDRRRRRTPTGCSVDRWGRFTCLERLSALLRSWLSTSWAQATRSEAVKPIMSLNQLDCSKFEICFYLWPLRARSSTRLRVICCSRSITRPYSMMANCPLALPSLTTLVLQTPSFALSPPQRTMPPFSSTHLMHSCCR